MKTTLTVLLALTSFAAAGFAAPGDVKPEPGTVLDAKYKNFAWGMQHHGCRLDENGRVWKYDRVRRIADRVVRIITRANVYWVKKLIVAAEKAPDFVPRHAAADAGITTWYGVSKEGNVVKLKMSGDWAGERDSAAARELVESLNRWCATER